MCVLVIRQERLQSVSCLGRRQTQSTCYWCPEYASVWDTREQKRGIGFGTEHVEKAWEQNTSALFPRLPSSSVLPLSPLLFPSFSMPALAALLSQLLVFRVTNTHRATRIVEGKDTVPYLRQANSYTLADYPKRSLIAERQPSPSMPGGRTSCSVLCVSSTLLCPLSILFIPFCSFVFCPFSCYTYLLPPPRLGPSSSGRADRRVPTFSRCCPNAEATDKKAAESHLGQ